LAVTAWGSSVAGVNVADYDTYALAVTGIDFNSSGRCWTYQYCTEYGWFQVPSHITEQVMRSPYLEMDYWPAMCERVFAGLDMTNKP